MTTAHRRIHVLRLQVFTSLRILCFCNLPVAFQHTELSVADIQCCPLPMIKQMRGTERNNHTQHLMDWSNGQKNRVLLKTYQWCYLFISYHHEKLSMFLLQYVIRSVTRSVHVLFVSCLFPGFTSLSLLCVRLSDNSGVRGDVCRGESNAPMAAQRFFVKAQWSGVLWVWIRPPRAAPDQQHCGTQE